MMAVVLVGASGPAEAMTYRPVSDENLVAASALIVIGEVEQVRAARLDDGRIVTQTELRVDATLKGSVSSPRIRVTEPGGRVGDVIVRIPGVPRFAPGERALVFLHERADGTLGTTALSLAKYTISAGTPAVARRTVPDLDERQLDAFGARIRSLAGRRAARVVGDGFGGPRAVAVDVRVDGFTLLDNSGDCDPVAFSGCIGGRWFEARCGQPLVYALSGSDGGVGAVLSREAVEEALAAWSSAAGGFLDLVAGPDVPTVPSALAPASLADFDGQSIVQFEDPFEIVPDLSGCQGILALGGTVSTPSGRIVEGDTSFDRTLEGDVVVNQGAGACLGAGGLAETLAHEIGHTLGFGHSSENPAEPDADLSDALMYFLIHDDGRGATLRSDDLAGLAFVYGPPLSEPAPAGEALRDVECLLDIGLWSSACFLDQEELGGFPGAPLKKAAKAGALARKAHDAPKAKKQLKLLKKADRQLAKAETKLAGFQSAGTLRPACAGALLDDLAQGRARLAEARVVVEAGL
jgi:hypothetical protein